MSWLPPSVGVLKINFDVFVVHNKAAAVYVIRDHDAFMLQAGGKLLPHLFVLYAELTAAWLGVRVAVEELHTTQI